MHRPYMAPLTPFYTPVSAARLPVDLEPLHRLRSLGNVSLDALASVEDGAVAGRADDVLVQRTLATLALAPEFVELELPVAERVQFLQVDLYFLLFAVFAEGAFLDGRAAPQTRQRPLHKLRHGAPSGHRHRDLESVVPGEQRLGTLHERLEYPDDRLFELVLEVVLRVDGQVLLQHVQGVLGLLVRTSIFVSLDVDECDAIADGRGARGVSSPHALSEFDVWLLGLIILGIGALG
mmetsp:Transcript_43837/g.109376  ORF Transcript_43837/g.109376 Transcript_43837/m.109376 type:complete len:236 (+) Transcript_43837:1115-1822(+)